MQNFKAENYLQGNAPEFVPGLSVIDSLMFIGPEATARLIQ